MKTVFTKAYGILGALCFAASLNAQINDLTPVANPSTICAGESSTISVPTSQNGVSYFLRNGSTVVGNAMMGNGSTLDFNTSNLTNTTTYNVLANVNNYALDFDGINDKVTTSYALPATATMTIEAWIFPRKTTGNRYFSSYSGGGTFGNGEMLLDNFSPTLNGQGLRFVVATAGNVTSAVSVDNVVTLNAWNHVAATFNNGTMKLYVDGVEVATANASFLNIAAIASTLTFGEDRTTTGPAEFFDGKMDEIRIWTTARTAAELAANKDVCLVGNETGLSAYYRMNDYQSTIAYEAVGSQNGTLSNMTIANDWIWGAPITCSVAQTPQYALDFDGTNDRVTTNYSISTATSALTIEAWIHPRATSMNRFISSYAGSNSFINGELILDNASSTLNGRGLRFIVATTGNTTSTLSVNNVLTLNAWNHVAVTFDNASMKIYVGGVQVASGSASFSTIAASSSTITLGEDRALGASEFFNGKMDEVRIWRTARTASEISTNKNNCVHGQTGLSAYYKLNEVNSSTAIESVAGVNGTLSNMNAATDWVSGVNMTGCPQNDMPIQDLIAKSAINFDGINDRITTTYEYPASNALTLEAWIFPRATTVNRYISSYSGGGSFLDGEMVLDNASSTLNGQGLRFIVATTGNTTHILSVDNVLVLNAWNHVAVTFDNGTVQIFVDGVQVATNTAPFSTIAAASSSSFGFGEDYAAGTAEFFDGKMDEVRFWTVARTASEILNNKNTCLIGNETGLSAYFQFNEGGSGNTFDLINNESGSLVSMALATAWVLNDGLLCNNSNFDDMQLQMSQTVTVTVNQPSSFIQTLNECAGFSVMVGSNTYTTTGTYSDTLVASNSCDSVVTTNLTVAAPINLNVTLAGTTLTADQAGATYQWLDCNNGNAPVAGETNQSFTPAANGDYAVEITVGNCTETTSCFNVTGVGIDQIANQTPWSVFPNPASTKLNIKTVEWTNIAIVNVLGQEMMTEQVQGTATIDISNFENGVYFVRNLNTNGVVKIVKN